MGGRLRGLRLRFGYAGMRFGAIADDENPHETPEPVQNPFRALLG